MLKKAMSILLTLSLLLSLCSSLVLADENEGGTPASSKPAITVTANANNTITVKESESEPEPGPQPGPVVSGSLSLSSLNQTIERDYEQECMITVRNYSSEAKEFYLDIVNRYDDLSMEIIKTGSKSNPAIIAAGESVNVELSVFAQNAENEEYVIPVTAYVLTDGEYAEDSKNNIKLTCELPILDLSWSLVSSNESTLRQTWCVTNRGETLTDLLITADDTLKEYLAFSPSVVNYELKYGESIEFETRPNLAKMKNDGAIALSGNLIASCAGKSSQQTVTFNTNGQEITVTTMGQLALRQAENPFTKVDIIEEQTNMEYFNGEAYVEFTADTELTDIVDENNLFDFQTATEVDFGVEKSFALRMNVKSTFISSDEAEIIDLNPIITQNDDGSYIVSSHAIFSAEEYYRFLNDSVVFFDAQASSLEIHNEAKLASESYFNMPELLPDGTSFLVDYTLWMNEAWEVVSEPTGLSVLGDAKDAVDVIYGGAKTVIVLNDPRLDNTTKGAYTTIYICRSLLTGVRTALSIVNPLAGFVVNTLFFATGFDDWVDSITEQALLAAIQNKYMGYQCTNRGRVTLPFYVPNYSRSGDTKPSVHTTSRMHGNGYVDKTDTNYNITLNGEEAGTVSNTGLTDVTIAEIPTDNLKPGETNIVDFDYDTSPGHFWVTTDTEITILYPLDTEIAYIGEPDDLQDVRTKPDFCIYDENIFTSDDLIVNEAGKLKFNAYNRGSRGGWFNIFCYENGNEVYREENYYLEAFSGKTFEFDWTPSAENTTVRVDLVNTSINLAERTTDNNSATRTVTARARQVPKINDLNAGTIYEHTSFSLMVDVEQGVDVTEASFTLDGTIQPTSVRRSDQGSNRRYWLTFDEGLEVGEHTLKVDVFYKSSKESESTMSKNLTFSILEEVWIVPYASLSYDTYLSGTNYDFYVYDTKNLTKTEISVAGEEKHVIEPESTGTSRNHYSLDLSVYDPGDMIIEVTMYYRDRNGNEITATDSAAITLVSEEDSYYTFSVGTGIESPEVSVYRYSSRISRDFEETENGVLRCLKTLDMYNNPEIYTVILSYSGGVIVTDMSKSGETITTDACKKLTIEKPDDGSISKATIRRISGIGNSSFNVSFDLDANKTLIFTPGTYSLSLSGEIDGVTFSRSIDVDLSSEDQMLDISCFVLIYYFDIASPVVEADDSYLVNLFYRNTGNESWYSTSMNREFNEETSILKCYSSSAWIISEIQDSEEALLLITTGTELYAVKIRDNSLDSVFLMDASNTERITLDRTNLNEVTLKAENEGWGIGTIHLKWNKISFIFYENPVYLPKGDYQFSVELFSETTTMYSNVGAIIEEDCEVTVGSDLSNFRDVTISWPEPFDKTGEVAYTTESGNTISKYNFESGSIVKVEEGDRTFYLNLSYANDDFEIRRGFTVGEANNQLLIGNNYNGTINNYFYREYEKGETISISVSNVKDAEGNELSYISAYSQPLKGQATFVNTEDSEKRFTTPLTATSLNGIEITLPEESGTYSYSVELTTMTAHTHALTHYAACPADCTQDGNVEYWACADCGTYYADAEARRPLSADELVLPALGHDWGAWVRVRQPTETAYGKKTRSCARCGAKETVWIQMLPSTTPETPTQPPKPSPEPHAFADVPETEWYVEAVNYAWDKGLMQGVSETEFAPDATADRAMLVTVLHRMAEEPEAAAAAFADVDADAWFAAAVAWASEAGVVSGYEDGLFHPNQPITREQLVTMLWRMAGKPAAEPVETGAADWAAEAMSWAIGRGVILGDGSGYSPRRTATRAEVAAILMRCDQL